jgi:Tol biopolymer transport system component
MRWRCAALLLLLCGCFGGARTGPIVPNAPAVTFERGGPASTMIFEIASPFRAPGGRVRVPGVNVLDHAMHPGGDWVAFSTGGGLFVQDFRGLRSRRSTQSGIIGIDWSPDARRLAYQQGGRIWVVDTMMVNPTPLPLTAVATGQELTARSPSWTPDGARIFFVRLRTRLDAANHPVEFDQQIWSMAADGSDQRLVHIGVPAPTHPRLAVARDGRGVLFVSGDPTTPLILHLHLASGISQLAAVNAQEPALSASGRNLAFIRGGQVWTCVFSGSSCSEERPLSDGRNDHAPSWVGL